VRLSSSICVLFCAAASAQSTEHNDLVDAFLSASHAEQNTAATIAGYVEQFSADATPEAKAQLAKRLNASVSWNAIERQYAALVARTYSDDDLKAAVKFLKSPEGTSFAQKTGDFQERLAALIAANAADFAHASASKPVPPAGAVPMVPGMPGGAATSDLHIVEAAEHTVDGRVQFVGVIENRSTSPARAVQLEVDYFRNGKIVDQFTGFLTGTLEAGHRRYFKVACGTREMRPDQHDDAKIQITESH